MDVAEKLNAQMRIFFALNAAGFFTWQAGDGFAASAQIPGAFTGPSLLLSGIGFGLWLVTLIIIFGQAWRAKKLGVYDLLSDEWSLRVRAQAAEAAFWITTAGVVISMTLTNFGVDGQLLLKLLTGLAVASFLGSYVWYDSRHEDGE
ncbi:MAG: hypothetical protein NXI12_02475 [Alphaproteobacteria bacterium]|nr:hypothetical protein [Alphaproteobacteria bacterium]